MRHMTTLLALLALSCATTQPPTPDTTAPDATAANTNNTSAANVTGLWMLTKIAGRPALQGATLELSGGKAAGDTGCNTYNTGYTLAADQLELGEIVQTQRACADNAKMEQERQFLSMLDTTSNAQRTGDTLTLQGAGGELVFASANTRQPGATWKLEIIYYSDGAVAPLAGRDISATFTSNTLKADLGCNMVSGTYASNANLMKVSELVGTARACGGSDGPARMAQEKALAKMLQETTSFQIQDGRLLLYIQGHRALQWTLVPSP